MKTANKKTFNLLFLFSTLTLCNASFAANEEITDPIAHGEKAHKNHCYKCHSDDIYTRENRFVKSIDALSKQVLRCKEGSNIPWFDEDADAVVQFLNKKYYRF